MIPVCVRLHNFLCYGETEQSEPIVFDFEESRLWSISGDNGAGKSAIFDAITYALYGQHRGGSQEDSRLIRKGANSCAVTFEFRLDSHLYRVRRTIGRPKGKAQPDKKTWQAAQFDPAINDWRPIKETERAAQLDRWVRDKLGLGYDTFVASVMLLQGQSDQLITAQAKKRFEILSGLLDLEPYKRLEAAASERMKTARAEAQQMDGQLQRLPLVTQPEIDTAEAIQKESAQHCQQAQTAVMQAGALLNAAQNYARLQKDLSAVQNALAEKHTLLQDAERIRGAYQEWQQLAKALPNLRLALSDLHKATTQMTQAEQARMQAAAIDVAALEDAVAAAEDAERHAEEQYQEGQARLELLTDVLPLLRDVISSRREQDARRHEQEKHGTLQHWQAEADRLQTLLQTQKPEKENAEEQHARAVQDKAHAQAALEQAQTQRAARTAAQHEAVCSRCGQPVNPDHIRREQELAEQAVTFAQQERETAAQQLKAAEEQSKAVAARLADTTQQFEQTRSSFDAARRAEVEWQGAQAKYQNALSMASLVPTDLLSGVTTVSVAEANTLLSKLNVELKDKRAQVKRAEEARKQASRSKSAAQQAHQKALRERERLQDEAKRLDEGVQALQQQAAVRLTDVDSRWQERALAQDADFIQGLEKRHVSLEGIEHQYKDLQEAITVRNQLETRRQEIERSIEDIRSEQRIPEAEASEKAEQAQQHFRESQDRRDQARQALHRLQDNHEERQRLEKSATAVRQRHHRYTRLAELLGRNGLQAHLLDAAVHGIERLANETLTRISGSQLRLHIERGEDEIAIRATDLAFSEEPLDVKFISGGQKFRVAVSLAAGIGQYAGRGAGSVRALIIDEGFGSLDTQGRQEMIDELRNLSQVMERIIIVSHQEDFQDRALFPTGYVLRKVGQQTQVERFV